MIIDRFAEDTDSWTILELKPTPRELEEMRTIPKYEFKKQVSTHIRLPRRNIPIIGTMWEFELSPELTKEQASFCAECGFGERNSMGFGFMNRK